MRSCYKSGMKMLPNAPENRTSPDYVLLFLGTIRWSLQRWFSLFPVGVPLGILCGGVPPGSQNPDQISDQKISFSTPVVITWMFYISVLALISLFFDIESTISASNGGFGSPLQEIIFLVYKKSAQMEWF